MKPNKIVILGAGPAGCAAAVQCKRLGITPLLMDAKGRAGGLVANGFLVENYPGLPPLSGPAFSERLSAHLAGFDIPVETGRVQKITKEKDCFVLKGDFGETKAEVLIAATGTRPRQLAIRGAKALEGKGVFYEVRELLEKYDPAGLGRVFIIGGGEAALDYGLTLAANGVQSMILIRKEQTKATGRLVEMVAENPGIELMLQAVPDVLSRRGQGIELSFSHLERHHSKVADAVLCAIGRTSTITDLFSGLDVDIPGAVSTKHQGLFVVGDARSSTLGQIGMAVGDGLMAAKLAVERARR